jgi:hypothetical protein
MSVRPRPGDLVEVEWVDSSVGAGWRELHEAVRWAQGIVNQACWSTGYMVERNGDGIVLVQSWTTDDGIRSIADALHVPAVAIRAVTLVRRGAW